MKSKDKKTISEVIITNIKKAAELMEEVQNKLNSKKKFPINIWEEIEFINNRLQSLLPYITSFPENEFIADKKINIFSPKKIR